MSKQSPDPRYGRIRRRVSTEPAEILRVVRTRRSDTSATATVTATATATATTSTPTLAPATILSHSNSDSDSDSDSGSASRSGSSSSSESSSTPPSRRPRRALSHHQQRNPSNPSHSHSHSPVPPPMVRTSTTRGLTGDAEPNSTHSSHPFAPLDPYHTLPHSHSHSHSHSHPPSPTPSSSSASSSSPTNPVSHHGASLTSLMSPHSSHVSGEARLQSHAESHAVSIKKSLTLSRNQRPSQHDRGAHSKAKEDHHVHSGDDHESADGMNQPIEIKVEENDYNHIRADADDQHRYQGDDQSSRPWGNMQDQTKLTSHNMIQQSFKVLEPTTTAEMSSGSMGEVPQSSLMQIPGTNKSSSETATHLQIQHNSLQARRRLAPEVTDSLFRVHAPHHPRFDTLPPHSRILIHRGAALRIGQCVRLHRHVACFAIVGFDMRNADAPLLCRRLILSTHHTPQASSHAHQTASDFALDPRVELLVVPLRVVTHVLPGALLLRPCDLAHARPPPLSQHTAPESSAPTRTSVSTRASAQTPTQPSAALDPELSNPSSAQSTTPPNPLLANQAPSLHPPYLQPLQTHQQHASPLAAPPQIPSAPSASTEVPLRRIKITHKASTTTSALLPQQSKSPASLSSPRQGIDPNVSTHTINIDGFLIQEIGS
eukprot:TRINITY_DN1675_c0_g2_i1.p1 TRINITY_DN1675_c0_g2~~TRINITY_DN1675_c0_g2_i1.p1  ORF type:complete len:657 (-),score=98.46 TRINITY_DN1675_c0_g2_i1:108-2078(-)